MAITDLNRGFPACNISSSFRINAVFDCMLLLDVSVIISSGITSFWVSVCKRTTTFSPHGHKEFTWWYGTLVWYTDIIDIYQPYGWTNGRHYDSLGMHRIMPRYGIYCVPRHEFRSTHCILQPFPTCWLLQNLTWCTLHPHMLGVAAVKMENWW